MTRETDRRFICTECGGSWERDDLLTLWGCGECGKPYNEKLFGEKCTRCHSQNTDFLTATACPEPGCGAETTAGVVEVDQEPEAHGDAAPEPKTTRSRSPRRRSRKTRP
jgi:hypothetical protein